MEVQKKVSRKDGVGRHEGVTLQKDVLSGFSFILGHERKYFRVYG